MNNNYRYQHERYRWRGSRSTSPQCGRKQSFTRYIDTYNNNIYISINSNIYINDNAGKCNRLDKCGNHYTPKQYFEEHPQQLSSAGDFRFSKFQNHRVFENLKIEKTNQPRRIDYIPEEYWVRSRHSRLYLPASLNFSLARY